MGFFDSIGDLFGNALGGAADLVEGAGSSLADGADVIGDAINPYVNPTTIASLIAMAYGMPTGFEGMNVGGDVMSGMDLAADGGFGNSFGLTGAFGQGSGLADMGAAAAAGGEDYAAGTGALAGGGVDSASMIASGGELGPTASWMDNPEPWRTVGTGLPPGAAAGGGASFSSLPSWAQDPTALGKKVGEKVLTNTAGSFLSNSLGGSKLGDLSNVIAGLNARNTQGQVAQGTQDQLAAMRAQITGLYGEGSPELAQMKAQMDRQDAAAGRRSQYGPRSIQLAGNIAKYKADALQKLDQGSLGQYVSSLNTSANANSGLYAALSKLMGNTSINSVINGISSLGSGGVSGVPGYQNGLSTGSNNGDQLYG